MVLAPVIKMPLFGLLGVYARYWRYASVNELMLLAGAAVVGGAVQGVLFFAGSLLLPELMPAVPRSIPLIDILVTGILIAGPRFAVRLWGQYAQRLSKASGASVAPAHVLIMGAGEAGVMVLRELQSNPQAGLLPVGFVDDDPEKHGMWIQNVRVLGGRERIPELVREQHVEQVIIAMPSAPGKAVREIVTICESAGARARIIPGMYELLSGQVSLNQIRDVQIEDLLRREPVRIDAVAVTELLRGKRVLVTGGGGSIGSELCRQILCCEPARLIALGHGENSIFEIVEELRTAYPHDASRIVPVIAGIRFPERIRCVFEEQRPEIVFHAAAHKHVPLMEENPGEAITNNVMGTRIVVNAALATGVERFVLISTDKAVNPTNIMGASKRAAELLVYQAARRSGKPYVAVRFGNVLGSRGSVLHTFRRQIAAGGPVTVTHPEMRRYFMTIPEAVQLVLQAAVLGRGGEVFVLDMGEPVKIVDLARDLIELSGLKVGRDIDIRFVGLRPGEKLFEELFVAGESYMRTAHHKIFVANNGADDADCYQDLDEHIDCLVAAAECGDRAAIVRALQRVVPEYRPPEAG